jgi:uncharacterized repeat protein (TIGR01451 family)
MRKILLTVGVSLALFSAMVYSSAAAVTGMTTLSGHVPAVVSHLSPKGLLSATTNLNLAIGLPLRNREGLTNLLQQIYDPASPSYHQYLTPEQFTARFGPTAEDYQKVIDFAKANGMVVTGTHPNRMLLDVSGKVSDIQNAFHVTLHTYTHPTESRDFFAPDVEPSVPSTLPVQEISGLDNYRRPHSHYKIKPGVTPSKIGAVSNISNKNATPNATTGSGPLGNYIGDDFRNAYVPGTSLNGSGQTIALVQFDGYLASDINEYEALAGRPNVPLQNVLLDGFNGFPTGTGGEIEVSLDIEMVISMAPALTQVILYEGSPFNFFPNDVLNRIATDNSARQISCSWGWTGGPTATTDQIFQQMALQGQTFFDAVGDSDAFTPGANSVNGVDNPFTLNEPSSNPFITQVGGTTLTMNGTGASYASETVWNWDIRYGPVEDGVGSSGGISSFYLIPSWQTNINMTAAGGSTTFRNVPDVALTADDVLVIADGGFLYFGTGGTSCASPLWAGFIALVNQQAVNNLHAPVGFINPSLYSIARGPNYFRCFNDITTGNNIWTGSPNLFNAVFGYDLCTGLGTPRGTNLINALTAGGSTNTITHISPPPPPYGTTLSTMNGSNPNGNWELFVQDDSAFDSGIISNGWWIALTTANPVGLAADSALTMTASSTNVLVGGTVVYSITVTNYGPSSSTNIIVSDTLPPGVTFVSASSTQGSVIRNGFTVVWNVGNLAISNGAAMTLTVQPSVVNPALNNSALVNTGTGDPNPDDDQASVTINVGVSQPPQLSATLVGSGHQFQFSITDLSQQAYVVQASTNLVTGPWVSIYTNPAPATITTIFTDPNAANYPYRFYRVLLQ